MARLADKIALVTGGSSGIGLAIAKRFVEEGATVVIAGRRQQQLDEAVAAIGTRASAIQADVTDNADLDRLYGSLRAAHGHLDILVANAGGGGGGTPLVDITEAHVDQVLGVNLRSVLFTVQKALPLMRDGGSIVMTSSIAASKGFAGLSVYGAAKAGLRACARAWTNELKNRRIRVNVVSPGPVETPQLTSLPKAAIDHFAAAVPLGRVGQPGELANAALFLASDESSFVTGTELFVDGGMAQV